MRRRSLVAALAGVALLGGGRARAQPAVTVGFLGIARPAEWADFLAAFRKGLGETGHAEGRNVAIAFRWAEGSSERLPSLAAELAASRAAVIVTSVGILAARAAKEAAGSTPIVFIMGGDPVRLGVVPSLNRPGGTITGVSFLLNVLTAKRVELLREIVPGAKSVGVLVNPRNPNAEADTRAVEDAARRLGLEVRVVQAAERAQIEPAFASFAERGAGAVFVASDPLFLGARADLVALAARHGLPAMYDRREIAAAGGLASYGPSFAEAHRQAGIYVGRILKGEKPADLPVIQPTTYELVINLRTAKALGLTIPQTLLVAADEVIE